MTENVEITEIWDNDIRFDKEIRSLGKFTSIDFDDKCKTFVTGTNMGWICVWDLVKREFLSKF